MQISVQDQRAQAEAAAAAWWVGKPFPEASWGRPYLCDVCGSRIEMREGTSLVESRLQCVNCTDRSFPRLGAPREAPMASAPTIAPPAPPPVQPPVPPPVQPPVQRAPFAPPAPPAAPSAPPAAPPAAPTPAPAWGAPPAPTQRLGPPVGQAPPPPVPTLQGPPAPRRRRKWLFIGVAAAAVVALVVGLVMWSPWTKAPPKVPTGVAFGSVTAVSATVTWEPAQGGATVETYRITRNGKEIASVPGGQTSFQDEDLRPGTLYKYSVVATAGDRRSTASKEVALTTTTPSPTGLAPGATRTTSAVSFRWSAPADAPKPDNYLVMRDGANVATVAGDVTAYKDVNLSPGSVYEYTVAAVWGEATSDPSQPLQISTANPSVASARVTGTYSMDIKVRSSGGGSLTPGMTWTNSWDFTPQCSTGPCSVMVSGSIAPSGYTTHKFAIKLTRVGGQYTGSTTAHITHCGEKPLVVDVRNTIRISVKVTAGEMDSSVWTATDMTGTMTMSAPYTSAGSWYCPAQSVSMYVNS